jgi:hypothetical protein
MKKNTVLTKKYRSDRELVEQYQTATSQEKKNEAAYEMWDKFYLLRQKMKFELVTLAHKHNYKMQDIIDSWDAYAWEKFIHQFDGIRLENPATKKPNWSNYIRLWGYWRSMNRDLIGAYLDFVKNNISYEASLTDNEDDKGLEALIGTKDNVDSETHKQKAQSKFWEAFDKFKETLSPKQKILLNMRAANAGDVEIRNKLGITKKIYEAEVYLLRERFKAYFGQDYNELLEDLQ